MCHLFLMSPVFGLVVFWLWPLSMAVPIYGVILVLSVWMYVVMIRSMNRPVDTGAEGMRGQVGKVIDAQGRRGRIQFHNEIWNAVSSSDLQKGDAVEIVAVDGLTLRVQEPRVSQSKSS